MVPSQHHAIMAVGLRGAVHHDKMAPSLVCSSAYGKSRSGEEPPAGQWGIGTTVFCRHGAMLSNTESLWTMGVSSTNMALPPVKNNQGSWRGIHIPHSVPPVWSIDYSSVYSVNVIYTLIRRNPQGSPHRRVRGAIECQGRISVPVRPW